MNRIELFNLARGEFNEELAVAVVVAHTVHIDMKIKVKDMQEPGRFEKRLRAKVDKALWETPELAEPALEIAQALYTYETCRDLQGLGGCVSKTLKQCVEEKHHDQP